MGRTSAREASQLRRTPEIVSGEVLASALECVEELERAICGESGVGSPAYAVGRSLSGLRAAGVRTAECRCPAGPSKPTPVVIHSPSFAGVAEAAEVVLVSGSHQAALENCIVARTVAETLGVRVEHAIAPGTAHTLGLARLPERDQLGELLAESPKGDSSVLGDVSAAVSAAFEKVQKLAGSGAASVRCSGDTDSSVCVVNLGAGSALCDRLADLPGVSIRVVTVSQCRPFPADDLRTALDGAESTVFVAAEDSPLHLWFAAKLNELAGIPVPTVLVRAELESAEELAGLIAEKVSPKQRSVLKAKPGERSVPSLAIAVHPAGSRTREILLRTGATLWNSFGLQSGDLSIDGSRGWAALRVGHESAGRELDLVVLLEDQLAESAPDFEMIRRGGGVILVAGQNLEASSSWQSLPKPIRTQIEQGELRLWWINALRENGSTGRLLSQALLSALNSAEIVSIAGQSEHSSLQQLDPRVLDSSVGKEIDFRTGSRLPEMEHPLDDVEEEKSLLRHLVEFHLAGTAPGDSATASQFSPMVPAVIRSELVGESHTVFPFYLPPPAAEEQPKPLAQLLSEALGNSSATTVLGRVLPEVLNGLTAEIPDGGSLSMDRLREVVKGLESRIDVSAAGKEQLSGELDSVERGLPAKGSVIGVNGNTWSGLYHWSLTRERSAVRNSLLLQVERLLNDLEALLLADDKLKPASRSAPAIQSSLGFEGTQFINPGRLSGIMPPARGSKGLTVERRERIVEVCASLRSFIEASAQTPDLYVFQSGSLEQQLTGVVTVRSEDPFDAALGLFDGLAAKVIEAMKAVRVGNLELSGEFNPEVHQRILDGFTWEALSEDEVLLLPSILVVEKISGLPRRTLPGFHRLLQSGMPIHVAVLIDGTEWSDADLLRQLKGVLPDPGYLGLAHREAFVLQSSVCRPDHLLAGLGRMMRAPGPGVLVLEFASAPSDSAQAWSGWLTAWLSRTVPFYSYDPWKGDSWADRFSVEGNRGPENAWVSADFECRDATGAEQSVNESITFAHFAALDNRLRSQFYVLPHEVESDRLVPVAEYLERIDELPEGAVPFIWVLTEKGEKVRRAVITRDLLAGCRDRSRAWRILQELAGLRNVYVERAVNTALEEASRKAQAERDSAVEAARLAGATEAVEKLVTALSNPDALLRGAAVEAPARPSAARPAAEAPSAPAPVVSEVEEPSAPAAPEADREPEPEEDELSSEPYIDSFLCTSCNDCINLNSRMFGYNSDRQAYIMDPSQGTFRELVRAAESCPASCIHPGQPRPGDKTATPELVERAKAFQ